MKTAISIPDDTFERAQRVAQRYGMNRSQFYSAAVAKYTRELESADVTAAINDAIDAAGPDDSAQFAMSAGRHLLRSTTDEW